jgi:hypothetical protein
MSGVGEGGIEVVVTRIEVDREAVMEVRKTLRGQHELGMDQFLR